MNLPAVFLLLQTAALASFRPCLPAAAKSSIPEPASLQALLDCQKNNLDRLVSDYQTQHGSAPSEATVEGWRERQRREARDFTRRYPERSVMTGQASQDSPDAAPEPKHNGTPKIGGKDLDALQQDLWKKSDQGRKGVTPEMAQEIISVIMQEQGSVSPDMAALLQAVQKDGADLTGDTVRLLQDAARKADAEGLDLEVKPDIKEFLLHGELQSGSAPPGVD